MEHTIDSLYQVIGAEGLRAHSGASKCLYNAEADLN
jgi:hypothetical protein